ncbi:hypothetical protein [Candidatus Methylacidiphilum infernorum]|uniref:hypothetical protein n=1 Tax=Candidatus Methylacidiphilum infernorum TaxID=511746 RepID=UPI0011D12736|nr:hypothetical protein [Candidatus Methylacidiphilum infernorum]
MRSHLSSKPTNPEFTLLLFRLAIKNGRNYAQSFLPALKCLAEDMHIRERSLSPLYPEQFRMQRYNCLLRTRHGYGSCGCKPLKLARRIQVTAVECPALRASPIASLKRSSLACAHRPFHNYYYTFMRRLY